MKIGVVLSTNEPEIAWNAFRFGVASLKVGHGVCVFLINKGVEVEDIRDEEHNVKEQIGLFIANKGKTLAGGACMKKRWRAGTAVCPASTMNDLVKLVEESDKILTFG